MTTSSARATSDGYVALLEALAEGLGDPTDAVAHLLEYARAAMGARAVSVYWGPNGDDVTDTPPPDTLILPLRVAGQRHATMVVTGPGVDAERARGVGTVVALALTNERLRAEIQTRDAELEQRDVEFTAVDRLARMAGRQERMDRLAAVVAQQARATVACDSAAVILKAESTLAPRLLAHEGTPRNAGAWAAGFAAIASGKAQVFPGPQFAVPFTTTLGTPLGAVVVARGGTPFDEGELARLGPLADHAGMAFTNLRLLQDLRAEQRRRAALAATLVDAQERERRRVAEDLHDGPVQELAGLALMLDAIGHEIRAPAASDADRVASAASVGSAADAARRAVGSIRNAISDLHPLSLEDLGFSAAVRGAIDRIGGGSMVVELLGLDAGDQLPHEARTTAFRLVQEAVANAIRHAGATTLRVQAQRVGDDVVIEVTDNGQGFDARTAGVLREDGHLGLAVMHERAAVIGGSVNVWSADHVGTRVRARVPVTPVPPV